MAEIVTKERVPYRIWDKVNSKWNELKFKTNANSVDANDGKTLQKKVGNINGITSDLSGESDNIAASIKCVKQLNDSLVNENDESFNFGVKDGVRGFFTDPSRADDSFIPFSFSEIEELNSLVSEVLIDSKRAYTANYTYSGADYKYICAVGGYRDYYGGTKVMGVSGTYDKAIQFNSYSGCVLVKLKETDEVTIITNELSNPGCLNIIGYC